MPTNRFFKSRAKREVNFEKKKKITHLSLNTGAWCHYVAKQNFVHLLTKPTF